MYKDPVLILYSFLKETGMGFIVFLGLVLLGGILFSFSAGVYLYSKMFTRKGYESHSSIDDEPHVKDEKIMTPLLDGKKRWEEKREERKIETIQIKSDEGLSLCGDLWLQKEEKSPVALLVHGFTDSAPGLAYLAEDYYNRGFSVLSINLRAHFQSQGNIPGFSVKDGEDIVLWLLFLKQRFGDDVKLLLHGVSMGASSVIMAVYGKKTQIKEVLPMISVVVADCGFSSFKTQLQNQIARILPRKGIQKIVGKLVYWGISVSNFICNRFTLSKASPLDAFQKILKEEKKEKYPMLILFHGKSDSLALPIMSEELFKIAPAPKRIVLVENAPHIGSYFYNPNGYMNTIIESVGFEKRLKEEGV